jgi:hypothetical protein
MFCIYVRSIESGPLYAVMGTTKLGKDLHLQNLLRLKIFAGFFTNRKPTQLFLVFIPDVNALTFIGFKVLVA